MMSAELKLHFNSENAFKTGSGSKHFLARQHNQNVQLDRTCKAAES